MNALFSLRGIQRIYGGRTVLDIAELDIPQGHIVGLRGPNGSGKSTLLRLLALLEAPDAGNLSFLGHKASIDDVAMRRHITLVLQQPYLLTRSVLANVCYGQKVRGRVDTEQAFSAMQSVGLDPAVFASRRSYELSGGEAKRVALAARLALRPKVLLLDEPTANIDESSMQSIKEAVQQARSLGTSVLIASHDEEWLAPLVTHSLSLRSGKVLG